MNWMTITQFSGNSNFHASPSDLSSPETTCPYCMMMKPGLASVTFRNLPPVAIVELCRQNRLSSIEWGGDVHVPYGEERTAGAVGELTRSAGLSIAAYGSYFRLGCPEGPDFSSVLATAAALGAPVIRVWAGTRGSAEASSALRRGVIDDALRCADLAAARNVSIAYEFHDGTLTDSTDSALELLGATEHPFIKTLWQPPHGLSLQECLASLHALTPRLQHVHVFHWWPDPSCRLPLENGRDRWEAYIAELRLQGKDIPLLLEFVRGDDPDNLQEDAKTLLDLCGV
jgi:sugar phosphate isomerase/epimerase